MFHIFVVTALILFTTNVSWALDWSVCNADLEGIRKTAATDIDAKNLTAASNMSIRLNDLYNNLLFRKYDYDACKTSADGTTNCVYTQRKLNTVIDEYKTEWANFNALMQAAGKYAVSVEEPCGYNLYLVNR